MLGRRDRRDDARLPRLPTVEAHGPRARPRAARRSPKLPTDLGGAALAGFDVGSGLALTSRMLPSEPPPLSRAALRRPRVLLVDDDPAVLRALRRMLEHSRPDFKINAASSASEALEALSELRYDAVITDLQMPGGGGQAVLEALLQHYPETARLVHSSQLEAQDTAAVLGTAHAVLRKPAAQAQLINALEAALRPAVGGRALPASAGR